MLLHLLGSCLLLHARALGTILLLLFALLDFDHGHDLIQIHSLPLRLLIFRLVGHVTDFRGVYFRVPGIVGPCLGCLVILSCSLPRRKVHRQGRTPGLGVLQGCRAASLIRVLRVQVEGAPLQQERLVSQQQALQRLLVRR